MDCVEESLRNLRDLLDTYREILKRTNVVEQVNTMLCWCDDVFSGADVDARLRCKSESFEGCETWVYVSDEDSSNGLSEC